MALKFTVVVSCRMQLFLDTEFTSLDQKAQLISLALCAEDGTWFYAEIDGIDHHACSPFVQSVVLPLLSEDLLPRITTCSETSPVVCGRGNAQQVRDALLHWLLQLPVAQEKHVVWADVLAWDWMLFCNLFGHAMNLPERVHYIPMDLATWLYSQGIDPDTDRESLAHVNFLLPPLKLSRHHALYDALLEQAIFKKIQNLNK